MGPTALEFDMLALGSRYLVSLGECSLNLPVAKATKSPQAVRVTLRGLGDLQRGQDPFSSKATTI